MHARLVLELRTAIPPNLVTDPAEIDQAVWGPWFESATAGMLAQARQAAPKLNCTLIGRIFQGVEVRSEDPVGRWLRADYEMGFGA